MPIDVFKTTGDDTQIDMNLIMNKLLILITALTLAGCATTSYQPFEGKNTVYEGSGGTKLIVDEVEFWANGSPPRKYIVIGVASSEIGSGIGDEAMIRSSVASEVKRHGGNAAIQITNNTAATGLYRVAPNIYTSTGTKRMEFFIIKYIQ